MAAIETGLIAEVTATAATSTLFKAATDRVVRVVKGPMRGVAIKALAQLEGYRAYLEETNQRVSTFKTFANPTQPVSLLDHFVTIEFESKRGRKALTQDDIIERSIRPSRFVISATAGYGKSMVMRYIALSLFENPRGRIPLFLELRHLNRMESPDILTYLNTSYRRVSDVQVEALRQGLEAGAFVLLLDGFDELNHELRPIIETQILALSSMFKNLSVIVSGRPSDRFSAWRSFTVFTIRPMSKVRVLELLKKLDYDAGVKKRFISKVSKGLYETHTSFLSTPLLAILMLLTYEQNANIPDKMHLFYAKAFETLYHKHDALKEQYDRSRKSGLQVDEFERVFSVFCLKTYVLEKTEFTRSELTNYIREALSFEGHTCGPENYVFDIEEAVCLIMREGTSYFFVHRSFQEYFTAVFLANCPEETRDDFMEKVVSRHWDNVLPMLFDMAQAQIEPSWVVNKCDSYLAEVASGKNKGLSPLQARFSGIEYMHHSGQTLLHGLLPGPYSKFILMMMRFYPEIFAHDGIDLNDIENYGIENWDKLPPINPGDSNDGNVTIKNVLFGDVPSSLLEKSGLAAMSKKEHDKIKQIRARIDLDQKSKNDFLNRLFAKV